ncbi:DUF1120 domain-containing protein [Pseudomonas sp. BCA14]|uniref:DUF1120 domain-containing protein n=1 Tax=unclassified Pseudomonas TaxID=196821 RepID=UPI00106E6A7F|nr:MULTISPECIES: DUF1120 domain-containing protein [unclassified Pseudomonas]TFF09929.1 DUF1120 domain-containing protein [Pseudomonas sp. JMN1]TFF12071.1 DUF1120 domain-containing protein [Pseudomonas sp. BCA17]TFF28847.1 DUF1120 domain-containing protein [Pseudomonas sp. BCA14]
MKASFVALAGTVLFVTCPWASAASSVDLAVKGTITPSACMPSLSQGGKIDYGKISAKDLNQNNMTGLPIVTLQAAVNCEAPTLFALLTQDNRPERPVPVNPTLYGLGVTTHNELIGTYFLDIRQPPLADGVPVTPLKSEDGGQTWNGAGIAQPWPPNTFTGFGNKATGITAPIPIQVLTFNIEVSPALMPAKDLTLTEEVSIDGSATLELRYL